MKLLRYGLFGLLLAAFLVGCSGSSGSGKLQVAFVTNNPHEFWSLVEAGCKAQAGKSDVEVEFKRPQNGTSAEQQEIINALLAKNVKAISISVQDPKNQIEFLNGVAAKVPLLAVDNDAPGSKRRYYIGTDNEKAGRAVGKLIKEAKPGGAKLALFVGQIEADNARGRIKGVLDELGFKAGSLKSDDGKYTLLRAEAFTDDTKPEICKEKANVALGLMSTEPDICLVGLWAYNPPAILAAVEERKLLGKVTIVGFDENLETLKGIDDGHIYGTVVQHPYEFGRLSVEIMAKLARGEKVDLPKDEAVYTVKGDAVYINERVVTKNGENGRLKAIEYHAKVKELLGK